MAKKRETGISIATSDESDKAKENFDVYTRARDDGHQDYEDIDKKANDYYRGDQWDKADLAKLNKHKRPALTINMVLSTINALVGEHASHRADIAFRPMSAEASAETASALSRLWMQISRNNKLRWREGEVFADGVIGGRGYFDTRLSFEDNLQGEVKITSVNPREVLLDPDAHDYDPDEWGYVIHSPWMSLDRIRLIYGAEPAKKLSFSAHSGHPFSIDQIQTEAARFGKHDPTLQVHLDENEAKHRVRSVRVIDRQYRKLSRTTVLVDKTTGDWRIPPEGWDAQRIAEFAHRVGLGLTERLVSRIRWTVTAGNVTLHDAWSPYDHFTIVPFFGMWRRGKPFGVAENLFSPQDQLNKVSSQELHVVNSTANSGYMLPAGSLVNMTADELEKRGAETGLVLEYQPTDGKGPEKIQPNQIPSGLANIAQKARENFRIISGVNEGLLGQDGDRASGVALDKKRVGGLVQMEVPFDNYRMTMELLARNVLSIVQKYYTEPRMVRVVDPNRRQAEAETVEINSPDPIEGIKNNITIGEYDVVVGLKPARETFEDTQFAEAIQLREAKVMVPDDVVIENSHLDGRFEIAERVRSLMGTGEPSEQELQIQQMQLELAMAKEQAEVAKLQAQAAQLQAQAQAILVKAQVDSAKPDLELQKIAADMQKQAEDIRAKIAQQMMEAQNKIQIAKIHSDTNRETTIYQTAAQRIGDDLKARVALAKPNPSTTSR